MGSGRRRLIAPGGVGPAGRDGVRQIRWWRHEFQPAAMGLYQDSAGLASAEETVGSRLEARTTVESYLRGGVGEQGGAEAPPRKSPTTG
jgi:hypothetical protein